MEDGEGIGVVFSTLDPRSSILEMVTSCASRLNKSPINLGIWGMVVSLLLLSGCSTQDYRRWADADVRKLLADRKDQTLGYQPVTAINAPAPKGAVPSKAYAQIPLTPIVPPQPSPVEPDRVVVPYGVLGPEVKWMRDWPAPELGPRRESPRWRRRRRGD